MQPKNLIRNRVAFLVGALAVLGAALPAGAVKGLTIRASSNANGGQLNGQSENPVISASGRLVAFVTSATDALAPARIDDNGALDIYVVDTDPDGIPPVDQTDLSFELISQPVGATQTCPVANPEGAGCHARLKASTSPAISPSGRYVAFQSEASNLVPGDSNGRTDVFLFDRDLQTMTLVSKWTDGTQSTGDSTDPSVNDAGHVAFVSAGKLHARDGNTDPDVYVHADGVTFIASVTDGRTTRAGASTEPAIAAGGSCPGDSCGHGARVVFTSAALLEETDNGATDVYVRLLDVDGDGILDENTADGDTRLVSRAASDLVANGASSAPSISADGLSTAFVSLATNLLPGGTQIDGNNAPDVFRIDLSVNEVVTNAGGAAGALLRTQLISVNDMGRAGDGESNQAVISPDGSSVAFATLAGDIAPRCPGSFGRVIVRDLAGQYSDCGSVNSHGQVANKVAKQPALSAGGRVIAFASQASNLDDNAAPDRGLFDVWVHDARTCPSGREPGGPLSGPVHTAGPHARGAAPLLHDTNCDQLVTKSL